MKPLTSAFRIPLLALSLILLGGPLKAQDPLKVGPGIYKLLFENERVRVMEMSLKPGERIGMHSHPDHLAYILTGGRLSLTHADGKSKEVEAKPGEVIWIPAESHSAKNPGTTELRALIVELKEPAKK